MLVAESFVLPTKFSGTMYKAANWECVGRSYARASGRYTDRGGEGSLRVSAASRCRLRDRSPLPVAWELRAPLVGAGVALDLSAALSGVRRGIASVLCVILLACEPARCGCGGALRRRRSWSSMEEQGQVGLHRVPGATDPGWIEDAARSRRSATRSTASAPARIITRRSRWPVFDPQLSRRGDRCRPRRDGRLLTLDALHTTREADHRDPSRGLMVKGNAPSRASTGRPPTLQRKARAWPPAHHFHPAGEDDQLVKQIFRVTRRVEFRKSGKPNTPYDQVLSP